MTGFVVVRLLKFKGMSKVDLEELQAKAEAEDENLIDIYGDHLYEMANERQEKTLDMLVFVCNELDMLHCLHEIFEKMILEEAIPSLR